MDTEPRKKRKRDLLEEDPMRPCPYPESPQVDSVPSHFLALPIELMHAICWYDGCPWSIGSVCTVTRRVWKTTGPTVVIREDSDLGAMQRAFPDAAKVIFTPRDPKFDIALAPRRPAFPRAETLVIKLGYWRDYNKRVPALGCIIEATVPCDKIANLRMAAESLWPWDALLRAIPSMPRLARLKLECEYDTGLPGALQVIKTTFRSVAHLRLYRLRYEADDLDEFVRCWNADGTTSRIETLHIHINPSALLTLESKLGTIRASHPRLKRFTVRPVEIGWIGRRSVLESATIRSLVTNHPFVRLEWPTGTRLPATAYPPPGTPVELHELFHVGRCARFGRVSNAHTLWDLLKHTRPHDPAPVADLRAMLCLISGATINSGGICFGLTPSKDTSLIKRLLLSSPPTATRHSRVWVRWIGFAFRGLCESPRFSAADRDVLAEILREIVRTSVHLDTFMECAFGSRGPGPEWGIGIPHCK